MTSNDILFLKLLVNDYLFICIQYYCEHSYTPGTYVQKFFFFECVPEVELLGHRKRACSMVLNNTILFSDIIVPITMFYKAILLALNYFLKKKTVLDSNTVNH